MGLVGREIVQSRVYLDMEKIEPNLNYKETFPNTVFDAVKQSMDPKDTVTLTDVLNRIFNELKGKQPIIPGRPSNYLVTYGGVPGSVGAIQISQSIPWKEEDQRPDRIPTEKAVGDLLRKFGFVDDNGDPDPDATRKVRWNDIIGRPNIYDELGDNDDGFIIQRTVTRALNSIRSDMDDSVQDLLNMITESRSDLSEHIHDRSNPHNVTIEQIGGVSQEVFDFHLNEAVNPHHITAEMLGLGKVDNTRDLDKPISTATQAAIDAINKLIGDIGNDVNGLNFVSSVEYTQSSGVLLISYKNGDSMSFHIPIDGLVDEITYDAGSKELIILELGGETHRVSLSDLFVRYVGSVTPNITVEIEQISGSSSDAEMSTTTTETIWKTNGSGEIIDEAGEVTKVFVDHTWDTNGEGSTIAESGEITKEVIDYHWGTNGFGSVTDQTAGSGGTWIIRAIINPKSITASEITDEGITNRLIQNQSVTNDKIKDLTITTIKYADRSITSEKISELAVTNGKLASRSVNGRVMFTSTNPNVVLSVLNGSTDPVWSKVNGDMIADDSIQSRHILSKSITSDKLADGIVTSDKIPDGAITVNKISNNTIINQHIVNNTIEGDKLITNITLPGTPSLIIPPSEDSDDNTLANTQWIRNILRKYVFESQNLGDRIVNGKHLFSSATRNRALVTLRAGSDPVWGLINHDMIDENAVSESNIKDGSVTRSKIGEKSITSVHLNQKVIGTDHLVDDAVTSNKIMKSHTANRVLAAVADNGNPIYTQVNRDMLENNAIGTDQIADHSISPSKFQQSDSSQRVLGVGLKGTDPAWMQVTNGMMSSKSVDGRVLFSTGEHDVILGVTTPDTDPAWVKINSGMIGERVVKREHIGDGEIWNEHIHDKSIESKHILDWTIKSNNIAPRAITGVELFTSPTVNRILGVSGLPYSDPAWMQVITDMIEDKAVTKEKIFQSNYPYRVLGTTQAGVPPEYIRINSDFIVDDSIIGEKLVRDIALPGTPSSTVMAPLDADDYRLATTQWVRHVVADSIDNFNPELMFDVIDSDRMKQMIRDSMENHSIDGSKLFSSSVGPRVLGVTAANEDVEFLLIEENLIADGAVTSNKLQRDIHLMGSPLVEVRPSPQSSDVYGGGTLIPDCQWVLDRIADGGGSSSTGGGSSTVLGTGSVGTPNIQDRSVTGKKIFTTTQANRVLGVVTSNGDPDWVKVTNEMIQTGAVTSDSMFTSADTNVVLGVLKANGHPMYTKVVAGMLGDDAVLSDNISDRAVHTNHVADGAITRTKLENGPIIESSMLLDNAVTNPKIADNAVDADNIVDGAITGDKICPSVELKGSPTVVHNTAYRTRSMRNITLSTDAPSGGSDGDIWFQYI